MRSKNSPRNLSAGLPDVSDIAQVRIAVALARASRWVGASAIAIATALLLGLFIGRPLHTLAALALSLGALSGAAAIYLMVRVELDLSIFEAASSAADVTAYFAAFDESRSQVGFGRPQRAACPVAERVQGLSRLARTMGNLFVLQLLFALVGFWIARWLS